MEQQLSLGARNREQDSIILHIILLTLIYYIQEEVYIPGGIRTMYTEVNRGAMLTEEFISTGHSTRIYNITRMKREAFLDMLDWLLLNTNLRSSRGVSAAEKVLIFLFISSHGIKFRVAAETFQHSTRTIHRAFYVVLDGLQLLHREFVVLPPDKTPDEIEQNDKHWRIASVH